MNVPVLNMKGVEVGSMAIDAEKLGGGVNAALIKQAYVRYHANRRVGTSKTLNRHNVEGSTRKIYKQKGTGNARHGDRKVPQFRGGSHAHHKQREHEDYRLDMPKKMRRKANLNALLSKLVDNEVRVIDSISMSAPKTKDFVEFLSAIKAPRSALIAVNAENQNVRKSGRNVEKVTLTNPSQLNCFDMLNHRYLVITKADLEAYLAGPSSQTGKDAKTNPLGRKPKEAA
ncbi:MAG: 50S ribosomal protein L4 [Phycisphaeraceae bacterium]|nr:50S ribosomal protein L4 [Phycisphaeraceae bacterium]